jgi:predicted RNA binding protein YcfA (HicA-like mRNA interferase family)
MAQLEKLIEQIRARPPHARYADVVTLLEAFGWHRDRERGSHVIFVKDGERSITVVKEGGRLVKRVYLDRLCERLGLDD